MKGMNGYEGNVARLSVMQRQSKRGRMEIEGETGFCRLLKRQSGYKEK